MLDYDKIPVGYMADSVKRYVEEGTPVGDFLTGLITNDLRKAVWHADSSNGSRLREWVGWFYNEAPSKSWGSPENYREWIEAGGLNGLKRQHND